MPYYKLVVRRHRMSDEIYQKKMFETDDKEALNRVREILQEDGVIKHFPKKYDVVLYNYLTDENIYKQSFKYNIGMKSYIVFECRWDRVKSCCN